MKRYAAFVLLAYLVPASDCVATDTIEFPEIPPEIRIGGGYYAVDADDAAKPASYDHHLTTARAGTKRAGEYYDLDGSFSGSFLYKAFPFPNRVHLEADMPSDNDWYGDFRHSYKDILVWRLQPRRFYHNLDNITLVDFEPDSTRNDVTSLDKGVEYGTRFDNNQFFLRLKTPDYPLHLYLTGETVEKKGTNQMRFLGRDALNERVSQAREIDYQTNSYTIGTNAHLGLVEVDISHRDTRFDPNNQDALYYSFDALEDIRPIGTFPHNVISESKASADTLKIHTSHTGRIVASTTFSKINKTNTSHNVEADNFMGYGDFLWRPRTDTAFSIKYRHQDNDNNGPAAVTIIDRNNPANNYAAAYLHSGVSDSLDEAIATLQYIPMPQCIVKGIVKKGWKEVEYQSALDWHEVPHTIYDTYELDLNWQAKRKIKVAGRLIHKDTRHDLVNTVAITKEPGQKDQGILNVTWSPLTGLTTGLKMNITRESTDDFRFVNLETNSYTIGANEYESLRERYLGSVSYMFSEKFSVAGSYAYMVTDIDKDLVFRSGGVAVLDNNFSESMDAHIFSLNFLVSPIKPLSMDLAFDYTIAKGDFLPTVTEALNPQSLGIFSEVRNNKFTATLDSEYQLENGWGTGLELHYAHINDDSYDNPADGAFLASLVKVTRKF